MIKDNQDKCQNNTSEDGQYWQIYTLRKSIILLSVTALLIVIILILKKRRLYIKQIKLFLKLFLLVLIFYEISLSSVLPHNKAFNHDFTKLPNQNCTIQDLMNDMIQSHESYRSAIQGFINLSAYAMTNWFALCILLYIRAKSLNQSIQFKIMNSQTWIAILGIIIWYLVPFILAFIPDMPFSFGPIGYFNFSGTQQYFFYSGIISRSKEPEPVFAVVVAIWYLLIPLTLCGYAIFLRYKTSNYIRNIQGQNALNLTQYSLIRLRKITLILCIVQIINPVKQILNFFEHLFSESVFIINVIFDLIPLILVYIYYKFYKRQGAIFQQDQRNRQQSQISQRQQSLLLSRQKSFA